jgi:hypothetical protein
MARFSFRILFIAFAALTLFGAFMTSIRHVTDVRVNGEIEHATSLAHNRLPQARELFDELRPYFDVLSASDELYQREAYILPHLIFTPDNQEFIAHAQWGNIPWLTPDELEAINVMLFRDIEGARDQRITFSDEAVTVTIYATPLHSPTGVDAWLGMSYRESVLAYPEHEIILIEPLVDDWHLTLYASKPSNIAQPFLIATIILAVVAIIFLAIYIWGVKTKRFA